jgi:hypothetical protein
MTSRRVTGYLAGAVMPTDVVDLWEDLLTNYVTDLRMALEPVLGDDGKSYLRVTVLSQRFDQEHPRGYDHIWNVQLFPLMGYSINPGKLFDLLIAAKESIIHVLGDELPF